MKINQEKTEVMVCSTDSESIDIKMDDDDLKQVIEFMYLGSIFIEDGKNKEDIIRRIKKAKVIFNHLKTKRRPLYLKTQFVPRSKHFSTLLYKPISLWCK